jgi:hypothetical protein
MDSKPPPHTESHARLGDALRQVDAALVAPDSDWLHPAAHTGFWAAWLRWMLQLLAFEFVVAWGDPSPHPDSARDAWAAPLASGPRADASPAAARPLARKTLERKIARLLEAAAYVWAYGHPPAAQPRRRRRRSPLLHLVCWIGFPFGRSCLAPVITSGVLDARVLALRKSGPGQNTQARRRPDAGSGPARSARNQGQSAASRRLARCQHRASSSRAPWAHEFQPCAHS